LPRTIALRFRRLLLLCLASLVAAELCGCTPLSLLASGHLDIESTEPQSRIAKRFPARHCKTVLLCVDLSNPVVMFSEGDDRIGLAVDVRIILGTRERTGRISLLGRPRYVPSQGMLFLDDLEITQLDMAGLPEDYAEWLRTGATLVARQSLQNHPVYTLEDSTTKGAFAKRTISDVRVVGGKLRVTFAGAGQ